VNPTAWWAIDGSWYVVTHPEADSTYVGCTEALAHRLVTARGLEAVKVTPHQPVWGSKIDTYFE
jgi:hypothetical protein